MRGELIRRAHRHALLALVTLVVLTWSSRAEAACTISTSGINFGTYSVFSATPDDATGTVTVDCTAADNNVLVTFSTGASGTFAARTMKKGAEALSYNLFAEASRTTVVGDGTSGSVYFFSAHPGNPPQTVTLYGRIPPLQDVSIGSYTDTVLASVNF
jgi:spore coat protein U domain-containing protein, fimbrial subunit CupE1/2/3/6